MSRVKKNFSVGNIPSVIETKSLIDIKKFLNININIKTFIDL